MAVFQSQDMRGQVAVYVNTQSELSDIYASIQFIKQATVLEDGSKWVLFPSGTTWHEVGGTGTVEAADMPEPEDPVNPFAIAIVGTAKVGSSKVG